MHFHPFQYLADVGVSVSLSATIGPHWLPIHIGPIEISASINLHGTPIAGCARLHISFFSVTVYLGPDNAEPPRLDLKFFLRMIKQVPADTEDDTIDDFLFSVTDGLISNAHTNSSESAVQDKSKVVKVRGSNLALNIQTRMPVIRAVINGNGVDLPKDADSTIYARPMQLDTSFSQSEMSISLKNGKNLSTVKLEATPRVKSVPSALFGKCEDFPLLLSCRHRR